MTNNIGPYVRAHYKSSLLDLHSLHRDDCSTGPNGLLSIHSISKTSFQTYLADVKTRARKTSRKSKTKKKDKQDEEETESNQEGIQTEKSNKIVSLSIFCSY